MALLVKLITLASAFVAGNTLLTLMVAFQYGTIHDVGTKVGDYKKTGGVPQPQSHAIG